MYELREAIFKYSHFFKNQVLLYIDLARSVEENNILTLFYQRTKL